jgi:hypothetical protein
MQAMFFAPGEPSIGMQLFSQQAARLDVTTLGRCLRQAWLCSFSTLLLPRPAAD